MRLPIRFAFVASMASLVACGGKVVPNEYENLGAGGSVLAGAGGSAGHASGGKGGSAGFGGSAKGGSGGVGTGGTIAQGGAAGWGGAGGSGAAGWGGTAGGACSNPIYETSAFPFTEFVSNQLPKSVSGWAEATCGGTYNWDCPVGYTRTLCEAGPTGSHGGCPYCLMSLFTCECN